jgi:serine/threonine protein kinase
MTSHAWEPDVAPREGFESDARRELGREFQLERVLTRSAAVLVFAAREANGRRVALHVQQRPRSDPGALEAALREGVIANTLDHPHVVPVYHSGVTAGLVWYSARLIEGRSLAAVLAERRALDVATTLRIAQQVSNALAFAHRRGVVHGDIRPGNILLEDEWALLADFGISRVLDRFGLGTGVPREAYRPPEDEGTATAAGDQYALATTFWECLTGTRPSPGTRTPGTPLPAQMTAALNRARHPRPAQRFPSVLDFVEALAGAESPAVVAPPTNRPPSSGQKVLLVDEQQPVGRWLGTAVILALTAMGAWLAFALPAGRGRSAPPAPPPSTVAAPARRLPPPRAATPNELPPLPPVERATPREPDADPARRAETTTSQGVEPVSRPPAPVAQNEGALVISSLPWGELYIDGERVGTTPKERLMLSAGPHRIEVLQTGFHPFRAEIHVGPGQEVRLVNIVLERILP